MNSAAPFHRDDFGDAADRVGAGLAGIRRGAAGNSGDAGAHILHFLFLWLHLNRVTLFALIFTIGILVDDAIVVVENIVRHFRLPESRGRALADVAVEAVDEVGNPTILATFAVIAAIFPWLSCAG